MEIRHHWPEEPEVKQQPSRFNEVVTGRLLCASMMLLIIGCIVLFMILFHDIMPSCSLVSIFFCTVFTIAVIFGLNRIRKWILRRWQERGTNPYHPENR